MKRRRFIAALFLTAVVILAAALFLPKGSERAGQQTREETIHAMKAAIMERALQCYVIEGAYPSELAYLEENYGLTVNRKDYLVMYTAVAENLPPQIVIRAR